MVKTELRLPLNQPLQRTTLSELKISIIIPAFNEERLLAATLECVTALRPVFTSRGWESELIVCDNNSTDRTPDIARAGGQPWCLNR